MRVWRGDGNPLQSDHYGIDADTEEFTTDLGDDGRAWAGWSKEMEWHSALAPIKASLGLLAAWGDRAACSIKIKRWVVSGRMRRLRQNILDKAVWWRSVLYVIGGHLGGIAVVRWPAKLNPIPSQHGRATGPVSAGRMIEAPEILELEDDEAQEEVRAVTRQAHMRKYLQIGKTDRGAAEKYLSNIFKPIKPVKLALQNENTGEAVGLSEAMRAVTQTVVDRAKGSDGDWKFNRQVRQAVAETRAAARAETLLEEKECYTFEAVQNALRGSGRRQASMRLPRQAAKAQQTEGTHLTWALANLVVNMGLVPSSWMREVTPIRKTGSGPVRDLGLLRPISYVDDLEGVCDALWLASTRRRLEEYMGERQSGGRYDYVLVVLGVVLALQERQARGLPTYLEVADLYHGYELVWRDAVRMHVRWAGVGGRFWLVLDAALHSEQVRLKIGGMIGEVTQLNRFSIGQGKRSGVHQFGMFTRALFDE